MHKQKTQSGNYGNKWGCDIQRQDQNVKPHCLKQLVK